MVGSRQKPIETPQQARVLHGLSSARVSCAGERILAIVKFHLLLHYSRDALKEDCSAERRCNGGGARARLSNQHAKGVRYPESAVLVCVGAGGAATGASAIGR